MTDLFLRSLFTWRSAVASGHGPKSPITRLALLTLSLHMSEKGESCFPSIALLHEQSALSERALKEHLALAEKQGWIAKRPRRAKSNTQGWRGVEYFTRIPAEVSHMFHDEQRGAPPAPAEGGALPAPPDESVRGGGAPHSKGGAPERTNVVHEVPTSTSMSTTKRKERAPATILPPDFSISDEVRAWAKHKGWEPYLDAHLEHFVDFGKAGRDGKLPRYADWDAAFRNCIRADWGDIRKNLIRQGVTAQKPVDTSCTYNTGRGEKCGMPGERNGAGYLCAGHKQKRADEIANRSMPPGTKAALERALKRASA